MCWMLTVEITSMPASSRASTSCQRFALREPGALVWASSSTRATCGCRASTASRSISSSVDAAVRRPRGAGRPRAPRACAAVAARPWVSTTATTTSLPSAREPRALLEHRVGLADAGGGAEQHPQPPRFIGRVSASSSAQLGEREVQLEHVHGGLAEVAEVAALDRRSTSVAHLVSSGRAPSATRSTWSSA